MKNLPKLPRLVPVLLTFFLSFNSNANTIYVDSAAVGLNDGTSWVNAYPNLSLALSASVAGDDIWVAKGTYQPSMSVSFQMKNGVKVYGGFLNTAVLFSDRNWVLYPSILKGNNNSVIACNSIDVNARLDGFIITDGHNPYSSGGGIYEAFSGMYFANLIVTGNSAEEGQGGGMYAYSSTSVYTNVVFSNNLCLNGQGGALYIHSSSPSFINVIIQGNTAYIGAGVFQYNSASNFINSTFYGNITDGTGGAIYSNNSPSVITNCIFWDNKSFNPLHNELYTIGAAVPTISYTYSRVLMAGSNNLSGESMPFLDPANPKGADGKFMTADDGLSVVGCRSMINAGNNASNTSISDLTGQPRIYPGGTIDLGPYEYQATRDNITLAIAGDTVRQMIRPYSFFMVDKSCRAIAELMPNGINPAADSMTTRVWVDNSVQSYNGQFYGQRHYDISLDNNAAIATASVTLLFSQAEFDAFNAVSSTDLPTDESDLTGIANLRITQYHGTSASGTPGTYSGAIEMIDPDDFNVSWLANIGLWMVNFNVTGFSGFTVTTDQAATLPLNLLSFTGQLVNDKTMLKWETANEINTHHFEVEESTDGTNFSTLVTLSANGSGDNTYSTQDAQTHTGNNYYRLKSVDIDGRFTYSQVVLVKISASGKAMFFVYPNPAAKQLVVQHGNPNSVAHLTVYNFQGQKMSTISANGSGQTTIDVSRLTPGNYVIEYRSDSEIIREKFVKVN